MRRVKPSLPVLHAALAYWERVALMLNLREEETGEPVFSNERDAEEFIRSDRNLFGSMLRRGQEWRLVAPSIAELRVSEDALIELRPV
jgi:hypothetical protein